MIYRPWKIESPAKADVAALRAALGLPELVCGVLAARGFAQPAAAEELCGEGRPLSDPLLMKGMDAAVARIHRALDDGERIVVFGDYDVDGVTATALLYTYLDAAGADVYYKLPNREDEGYGLSEAAVELMAQKGVQLIITVDNGVSAAGPVAAAKEKGIDVVVTDHHLPPPALPDAAAVVDPLQPGDESPCKTLSGAGVAFKLITALDGGSCAEMLPFYGDLAALGTIADIMVLEGENRTLVKAGLALLQQTDRPGLAALIETSGLAGKHLGADNVSFGLAPRLNAAGRMDDATAALRLLLSEDEEEAGELAQALEDKNAARQQAEQEITGQIMDAIAQDPTYQADRVLVVWGRGWHQGVIGIVASRIVERFGKPAIIVSVDETGEGKGSGRSIPGFSLYDAIAASSEKLIRFGGHALAAGLSVREEDLPWFRQAVNAYAAARCPVLEQPALKADLAVQLGSVMPEDVAALDVLAPFGNGNPAPLFAVQGAAIEGVYSVSDGKHCRVRLRQGGGAVYAVLFGQSPASLGYGAGDVVDVLLSLSVYEGKNGPMVSARIKDIQPAGLDGAYLDAVRRAEAWTGGVPLEKEERETVHPQRADTAAFYRLIAARPGGVPARDLRPLFAKLGAANAGKALISLLALEQLGLVEKAQNAQGAEVWRVVPGTGKKDLSSAPVLRGFEE